MRPRAVLAQHGLSGQHHPSPWHHSPPLSWGLPTGSWYKSLLSSHLKCPEPRPSFPEWSLKLLRLNMVKTEPSIVRLSYSLPYTPSRYRYPSLVTYANQGAFVLLVTPAPSPPLHISLRVLKNFLVSLGRCPLLTIPVSAAPTQASSSLLGPL